VWGWAQCAYQTVRVPGSGVSTRPMTGRGRISTVSTDAHIATVQRAVGDVQRVNVGDPAVRRRSAATGGGATTWRLTRPGERGHGALCGPLAVRAAGLACAQDC
jgi:hypothetical protein